MKPRRRVFVCPRGAWDYERHPTPYVCYREILVIQVNEYIRQFRPGDMPEPGLHKDVPFEQYLSWPCVNAGLLKAAARSAAHAQASLTEDNEPSDALRFGSFAHAGRLEPLAVTERYVVMPDLTEGICKSDGSPAANPKATKEYKQRVANWQLENGGDKEIVPHDWYEQLTAMNARLIEHERAVDWLNGYGPAEVSIVWDDPATGVRCKARADKLRPKKRRCVDYKTCRGLDFFAKDIVTFGYDVQGAFYRAGLAEVTSETWGFDLVAQEKTSPFVVNAAPLSRTNLEVGAAKMRQALDLIVQCVTSGEWPGPPDPETWERPAWAMPEDDDSESIGDWLRTNNTNTSGELAHV